MSSGGSFQAFGAQIAAEDKNKILPGVPYSIEPINTTTLTGGSFATGVSFTLPQ